MCRTQGYFQYFALLLLLSLCLINQVSSRKCYACKSDADGDCISAANQNKFIVDCLSVMQNHSWFNSTLNKQVLDNQRQGPVEYDCAYGKGISTIDGRTIVERGCAVKPVTCDTYKIIFAVRGEKESAVQLESCKRCDSDLCNASGHLSIGIWTLSLSLLALYFIKF